MQSFVSFNSALININKYRARHQVWLILSLNQKLFFNFRSTVEPEPFCRTAAKLKLQLSHEISQLKVVDDIIWPLQIEKKSIMSSSHSSDHKAEDKPASSNHFYNDQVVSKFADMIYLGIQQYLTRFSHAEEQMILHWHACLSAYLKEYSKLPKQVEIYLSHSPCTEQDIRPSTDKIVNDIVFPKSCQNKLKFFAQLQKDKGLNCEWSISYLYGFYKKGDTVAIADWYRQQELADFTVRSAIMLIVYNTVLNSKKYHRRKAQRQEAITLKIH